MNTGTIPAQDAGEGGYTSTMNPNTLTAQDRCDRCGAAALGWGELEELYLQFCGHHLKEFRAGMESAGWEVFTPEEFNAREKEAVISASNT